MKIEYLGHASFRITARNGTSIVTDPYEPGFMNGAIAYGKNDKPADIVTISHEHGDHNYAAGVPGNPEVVKGPGAHAAKGIEIQGVASFHDEEQGTKRGPNSIMCIKVDGMTVCHLGDLGHPLSDKEGASIGAVDVLMTPVGGFYTIDAKTASAIVNSLKPKVVLPMHYKSDKCNLPIASLDDFIAGKENVKKANSAEVEISKESLPASTQIIVLNPAL